MSNCNTPKYCQRCGNLLIYVRLPSGYDKCTGQREHHESLTCPISTWPFDSKHDQYRMFRGKWEQIRI